MKSSPSIDGFVPRTAATEPGPVVDLDDAAAMDPRSVGAKASWLARARRHGLPVLPGVVVTVDQSAAALDLGVDALARRGSGGARLEVSQAGLPAGLMTALAAKAATVGPPLVVRSSSVLDDEREWAGAFSSFVDILPDELPRAIAGCWASVFNPATLDRFDRSGRKPSEAAMAVLIQPALVPRFGGVARLAGSDEAGGDVQVTAVAGSPAAVVQGREAGMRAAVARGGEVDGEAALSLLGGPVLREIAATLRTAHDYLGATTCEWALEGDRLVLLQLDDRPVPGPTPPPAAPGVRIGDRRALSMASLASRYPGPLGEVLILGWAAAHPEMALADPPPAPAEPVAALDRALALASVMTGEAWGRAPAVAGARAAAVLRHLRGRHPDQALAGLRALNEPDPDRVEELLSLIAAIKRRLVDGGRMTEGSGDQMTGSGRRFSMWRLTVEQLRDTLTRAAPIDPGRIGPDPWGPFRIVVAQSFGQALRGVPASPGVGAGRLCLVARAEQVRDFRAGDVVVAPRPVPNLAPLLWEASGLVSLGGGPGAHLFEAARALKVPAVCGLGAEMPAGGIAPGQLAAVDGDAGTVHVAAW